MEKRKISWMAGRIVVTAKRKKTGGGGGKFYAVAVGKQVGVFGTWGACSNQVKGYPGAVFKSFPTYEEAEEFVASNKGTSIAAIPKIQKGTENKE